MKKSIPAFHLVLIILAATFGTASAQTLQYNVQIYSNVRGAGVSIDGTSAGVAPVAVAVTAGIHTVRLRADGFVDYIQSINVTRDMTLSVQMMPSAAPPAQPAKGDVTYRLDPPEGFSVIRLFGAGRNYVAILESDYKNIIMGSALPRQGPYEFIGDPILSPDGSRAGFVYQVQETTGGMYVESHTHDYYYVYTPAKTFGPFDDFPEDLCCSPSGDQFAFITKEPSGRYVNIGSSRYGPYDGAYCLEYLPGVGFVYVMKNAEGFYMVEGVKRSGPYYKMYKPFISADGRTKAYIVEKDDPGKMDAAKSPGTFYIIENNSMNGPYRSMEGLSLTEDGKNYFYLYEDARGWWIRSHKRTVGPINTAVVHLEYCVSNDGSIAYVLGEAKGKDALYVNGVLTEITGDVTKPFFSADGTGCAVLLGSEGAQSIAVRDSKGTRVYGPYGRVSTPVLSADASTVVFSGRNEKGEGIYVNGKVWLEPFAPPGAGATEKLPFISSIFLSPDGQRIVYLKDDPPLQRVSLYDGTVNLGQFFSVGSVQFAPDSSCAYFILRREHELFTFRSMMRFFGDAKGNIFVGNIFPGGSVFFHNNTVTVKATG